METTFVLNYLNNLKRMPPAMKPFKDISVKNIRGDEIKPPEPIRVPMPELKPRPVELKPECVVVASGQTMMVVGAKPIPASVPSGQVVSIKGQQPVIITTPPVPPDVMRIAENIAIGEAANVIEKKLAEKNDAC